MNPNIKSFSIKREKDKNGVWIADIKYYSPERDKIYIKENATMFPISWNPSTLMIKIYTTYKNKQPCPHKKNTFHSLTDCGIPVDFIIVNNEIKSLYPKYTK